MYLNVEQILKPALIAMKINRSHPFIKRDSKWLKQFILIHGFYVLICIIIFFNLVINIKAGDFTETCKNGAFTLMNLSNSFSYFVLLRHQSKIAQVIQDMQKDYVKAKTLPKAEQDIIYAYAKKGEFVCKLWFFQANASVLLFLIQYVMILVYSYIQGHFQYIAMQKTIFPSFIEDNMDHVLLVTIKLILQINFGFYAATFYYSITSLPLAFMLHATGQVVLIRSRVDVLFKSGGDNEEIQGKINAIIKELQYIYMFVNKISESFELSYELSLKVSGVTIPIISCQMLQSLKGGEISMEFLTFLIGVILLPSYSCYYGDLLMEKGEELRQSIYFSGWEDVRSRRLLSTLRVMQLRCARPLAIRSLFRVLCLETLIDVFQEAYAIFNLINVLWS